MRSLRTFLLVCAIPSAFAQTTGKLGDAKPVNDSPVGAAYIATFNGTSSPVSGKVIAISDGLGMGVNFHISLSGLPKDGGPYGKLLPNYV